MSRWSKRETSGGVRCRTAGIVRICLFLCAILLIAAAAVLWSTGKKVEQNAEMVVAWQEYALYLESQMQMLEEQLAAAEQDVEVLERVLDVVKGLVEGRMTIEMEPSETR